MKTISNDAEHLSQLCSAIRLTPNHLTTCLGQVDSTGRLCGGTVYHNYRRVSVEMHAAAFAPNWISRQGLWSTFHYPFVHLGVRKIIGPVPSYNRKSLEFCRRMGFNIETTIKDVFEDGDLIIMSLYRDDCRWLSLPVDVPPHLLKEPSNG